MRKCATCHEEMDEGWLVQASGQTYCSNSCGKEEYGNAWTYMLRDDDAFWTTWYNEED